MHVCVCVRAHAFMNAYVHVCVCVCECISMLYIFFRGHSRACMNQLGLLQLSCAAVQVATHPSRKNWEKLLSVEKVLHYTHCSCIVCMVLLFDGPLSVHCFPGGGSLSEGWCGGECL